MLRAPPPTTKEREGRGVRVSAPHHLGPRGLSRCPLWAATVASGWASATKENSIQGEEEREVSKPFDCLEIYLSLCEETERDTAFV